MKKIIFTRIDDGLSIVHPAPGERLATSVTLENGEVLKSEAPQQVDRFLRRWPVAGALAEWAESEDEFVARVAKKDVPQDAKDVQIVDESVIPSDRTFRDAWKAGTGSIDQDMDKCREIQKQRLRELRAPLFKDLDIQFMKALETGDTKTQASIAAQKQALRDVTSDPRLDVVTTPEELKLVIPDALTQGLASESVNGG